MDVWDQKSAFDAWVSQHPDYMSALHVARAVNNKIDVARNLYHVSGIPVQYVISPSGKISAGVLGYDGSNDALEKAIAKAQSAQ